MKSCPPGKFDEASLSWAKGPFTCGHTSPGALSKGKKPIVRAREKEMHYCSFTNSNPLVKKWSPLFLTGFWGPVLWCCSSFSSCQKCCSVPQLVTLRQGSAQKASCNLEKVFRRTSRMIKSDSKASPVRKGWKSQLAREMAGIAWESDKSNSLAVIPLLKS